MGKYLQLAKLTFQDYFVYRLNFVLWRFRSFVVFLTLFSFWLAIYGQRQEFLGYQKGQMLAYVAGIAILRSIVLASRSADLADQIRSGELTKLLIQPIKIAWFWLARDLVDKGLNLFFTFLELGLILAIFKFPIYFPSSPLVYLTVFFFVSLSFFLYFFISYTLSVTAFWTEEIWATRWLFGIILLQFFAGAVFPIDILPGWLAKIIYFTPFPYLVFFPLKIWLEQLSGMMIVRAILICSGWLVLFYWLTRFLWQKGIKSYQAYGG